MRTAIRKREKTESDGTAGPRTGIVAWGILACAVFGLLFAPSRLASSFVDPGSAGDTVAANGKSVSHSQCGESLTTKGRDLPDGGVMALGDLSLDASKTCSGAPRGCSTQGV